MSVAGTPRDREHIRRAGLNRLARDEWEHRQEQRRRKVGLDGHPIDPTKVGRERRPNQ